MYKRPAGRFFILVDGPHFVPHRDTVRLSFVNKPHTQHGPCPFESCAALVMRGAHVPAAPELCGACGPAGVPKARRAPRPPYTAQPTDAAGSEALSAFVSAGPGTAHAAGRRLKSGAFPLSPGAGMCYTVSYSIFGKAGEICLSFPREETVS